VSDPFGTGNPTAAGRTREPITPHAPPALTTPLAKTASAVVVDTPRGSLSVEREHDGEPLSVRSADALDRSLHYFMSSFTRGISPFAVTQAYLDWLLHLAGSPGKLSQLRQKSFSDAAKLLQYLSRCALQTGNHPEPCAAPLPNDKRFSSEDWHRFPFNIIHQSFLLQEQWWHEATTGVRGVSDHHARVMAFAARQMLDVVSPSNFLLTNPDLIKRTQGEGGRNLARGYMNFLEDWERAVAGKPAVGLEAFKVGVDIAVTPGKIVYRNRLIELIQYEATTTTVRPEPVLFIPAWIMKYYILDLSPHNSLVRYLRDQGFTVFMVSWKNPGSEERDLGMEDYFNLGVTAALDAIAEIVPGELVHGAGYCLGGTLLSMAAAALARDGERRFKSLSFFAAQTDFTEAGELTLFTSESQVAFLEDMMWEQGYLDSTQMAGAFQMLRSSDLIWSRIVRDYLMGERQPIFDLMAWNADSTRMPYRMHSEYLRRLFLGNDLAEGRYRFDGRPIALNDIREPCFVVGTETDHVSPWRSVFKFNVLTEGEVTFVLTSGGHNAGIVSEPGHSGRHYRIAVKQHDDLYIDPDTWVKRTPTQIGSWWLEWSRWLEERSGEMQAPPALGFSHGHPLEDAPGTYVMQR
jgi:polyhydroxyalkanoate synthase